MMIPYIHKLYCGRTRLQLPLSWKIITFYEHCHVMFMLWFFFLWWSQFSLFYSDYVCKMEDDTRYKNACMLSSRSSTILCIFCVIWYPTFLMNRTCIQTIKKELPIKSKETIKNWYITLRYVFIFFVFNVKFPI